MSNRKMQEYNRGLSQGLDMARRLLEDAGETKAAALIAEEIRIRGKLPVKLALTSKEIDEGIKHVELCMYETFLCQSLMVLHDQFGFGRKRCLDFMARWNLKTDCMSSRLVNWTDYIKAIKDELDIDVPTECMREEALI